MGSKYALLPHLERTFAHVGGTTAVDAFSGSDVVSYLLKAQGSHTTANDFMAFSSADGDLDGVYTLATLDVFRTDLAEAARLRGLL